MSYRPNHPPSGSSRDLDTNALAAGPSGSAARFSNPSIPAAPAGRADRTIPLVPAASRADQPRLAVANDSRRYTTSRLRCLEGFEEPPACCFGASFTLPIIRRYVGRDVKMGGREWEIWSPNSNERPYFAGAADKEADVDLLSENLEQRRLDGNWGRFDHYLAPQYADERLYPWAPFILRSRAVSPASKSMLAFHPVHAQWTNYLAGNRIEPRYLSALREWNDELDKEMSELRLQHQLDDSDWESRPPDQVVSFLDGLADCRKYEIAVDNVAVVQRQLRSKEAWIAMVKAMVGAQYELESLRTSDYPLAQGKYLGAFINSATEIFGRWLLAVGVPVFYAHAYHPREIRRRSFTHSPALTNCLEGTELIELLGASSNGFEHLAGRLSLPLTAKALNLGIGVDYTIEDNDPRFSSSLFLDAYSKARVSGTELPTELCWDPRYMPRPLDLVTVAAGRHPWVRPPRIEELKGKGKWEKWEECSDSEGEDVELRVVKRAHTWKTDRSVTVRYDREKRRELYLRPNRVEQRGVVRADTFGWPAPRIGYWEKTSDGRKPRGTSYWVYASRDPPRSMIGMMPATPLADELPLLDVSSTPPPMDVDDDEDFDEDFETLPPMATGGPGGESHSVPVTAPSPPSPTKSDDGMEVDPPQNEEIQLEKGKGKMKEVEVDGDVDAVSLGPTSDEEEAATAFLRVRGLKSSVGVFQFARLLSAFFKGHEGIEMSAVLDARRAMWVSLSNSIQGEAAKALLAVELATLSEGKEVEIGYVEMEEFEEAQKYTNAIWHPGLVEDVPAAEARTSEAPAPVASENQKEFRHWVDHVHLLRHMRGVPGTISAGLNDALRALATNANCVLRRGILVEKGDTPLEGALPYGGFTRHGAPYRLCGAGAPVRPHGTDAPGLRVGLPDTEVLSGGTLLEDRDHAHAPALHEGSVGRDLDPAVDDDHVHDRMDGATENRETGQNAAPPPRLTTTRLRPRQQLELPASQSRNR
ncbi:hypothetical protein B0H16DRAFT_1746352 [Mycena metata]|uniref:Uncharacterized protein n=1 Tax=Mycena metata TaxID=1033252 RepID=A0AAD7GYK7_9AGAR|nr:hypothetical protein B0H16DRAFT_1746352 [Mycena metata]